MSHSTLVFHHLARIPTSLGCSSIRRPRFIGTENFRHVSRRIVAQGDRWVSEAMGLGTDSSSRLDPHSGIALSVGGPAFVQYIRPSDEELVKRYSPELKKRSAEQGQRKEQEFDDYVTKLKEWSKSDKSSMFGSNSWMLLRTSPRCVANELVISSLVRRSGGAGGKACTDGSPARSGKGGVSHTTGGNAQGDAGREMIAVGVARFLSVVLHLPVSAMASNARLRRF